MTADQSNVADRMYRYYIAQGEKYSFAELWPRAVTARMQLLDSLAAVSEEEAAWSPEEDIWSIKEVAHHILNSSRHVRRVVLALAAGQLPDASGIEPPRETTDATMDELRAQLRDDGIEWAAVTKDLPARPPMEPTVLHPRFGELPARSWYLFQRTHDLDHMNQINAVKAADGYPAAQS